MKLKESAQVTIGISLLIILMGILTGVILFYAAGLLSAIFVFIDYYRLIRAKEDIRANVDVKSGLSRNTVYLGASTQLVCRLINNGAFTYRLHVNQPLDDSIKSDGVWKPIELSSGSTVYLKMLLEPSAGNLFSLEPPEVAFESWLFKDSFSLGKMQQLNVLLPVGVRIDRIGPSGVRSKSSFEMFDATTIKKGQGADFHDIRKYVGGDNIRHIDWIRSGRLNDLMVRDYEDDQPLPVFIFIDLDTSMGLGSEHTALQTAVDLATELVNKYVVNGERIGVTGFTGIGTSSFIPPLMGNEHLYDIRNMLSRLKTVENDGRVYRHEQGTLPYEIKTLFKDRPGLFIDDMLREYSANIDDDGFSRAIRSAIRYLNTSSRMVVITNLSMGLASLMNNARIAVYYGHKVSVVLIPHMWHDEREHADAEAENAVLTLKANGIDAIVMHPGERPDSVIKRGRLTGIKVRTRR